MLNMFQEHRARFLARLAAENAAAIVPAGGLKIRNHDSEYRFRPRSDFYYLTGFREPDAVLVLVPACAEAQSILFVNEKDREAETWTGRRLGTAAAPAALGVQRALPLGELWTRLSEFLPGHTRMVHGFGEDPTFDQKLLAAVGTLQQKGRAARAAPRQWVEPALWLHELRLRKDEAELDCMRRAARVTAEAHRAVMAAARPGINEGELDGLLDYTFRRRGGTGSSYGNIVAGGAGACILHYRENDRPLVQGELCLVDAGCEWNYYASDVTRTFPVGGRFSREQRALYELVLRAQEAAILKVRPGATHDEVHDSALAVLVDGLLALGLLSGAREKALAEHAYRRFYMHRTGHWLGLDVHDCGLYTLDGAPRPFEPGMVTTVEPGLYVAPDDETVEARWRGIGIRIEDDVLVTPGGHEVLTREVPKSADEVEDLTRVERTRTAAART
ncbi:MAG: M24 family metallopeptidase [Planctomycetes bacterium]|nr:M24 family metallopeptidase [Planctomycetota bacterium]